ncbi:MAG: hypothetical protein ACI32N_08650 [Bulleidia sp.]
MDKKTFRKILQDRDIFRTVVSPALKNEFEINAEQLRVLNLEHLIRFLDDEEGHLTDAYDQIVTMQDDSCIYCAGFITDDIDDRTLFMHMFDLILTLCIVYDQVALIHDTMDNMEREKKYIVPVLMRMTGTPGIEQGKLLN